MKNCFLFTSSSLPLSYFLSSNWIISKISDKLIHSTIISDHAPISLTWNINHPYKNNRWWFNTSLFDYPDFGNYIKRECASIFELNDSPEIAPSQLWETGKAVLRGKKFHYIPHRTKRKCTMNRPWSPPIPQCFTLHGGTRQGWPHSSSLVSIVIDPLAAAIQTKKCVP